jgi:hypothetical protein
MRSKGLNCKEFKIDFDISDFVALNESFSNEVLDTQTDILLKLSKLIDYTVPKSDGITPAADDLMDIAKSYFEIEVTAKLIKENPNMSNSYVSSIIMQLKALKDFLSRNKIEVINHTGQKYNSNLRLDVIDFVDEDVDQPIIIETIEPSIKADGKLVKLGKVIVAQKK